ncbi:GM10542 [Drosophila sechellia]|uniref:GM10542 n=1 Tax=Drosophila sechellia TaxID=7238 RepID=B4I4H8_DROSE|nr:GM10542 [Drosophila sechellia]
MSAKEGCNPPPPTATHGSTHHHRPPPPTPQLLHSSVATTSSQPSTLPQKLCFLPPLYPIIPQEAKATGTAFENGCGCGFGSVFVVRGPLRILRNES